MGDKFRHVIDAVGPWFWGLAGGVLVLYMFGWVMGAFSPDELIGWTIVAGVLALLVGWHSHKVHVALKERDPELMRTLNKARETRGF